MPNPNEKVDTDKLSRMLKKLQLSPMQERSFHIDSDQLGTLAQLEVDRLKWARIAEEAKGDARAFEEQLHSVHDGGSLVPRKGAR